MSQSPSRLNAGPLIPWVQDVSRGAIVGERIKVQRPYRRLKQVPVAWSDAIFFPHGTVAG